MNHPDDAAAFRALRAEMGELTWFLICKAPPLGPKPFSPGFDPCDREDVFDVAFDYIQDSIQDGGTVEITRCRRNLLTGAIESTSDETAAFYAERVDPWRAKKERAEAARAELNK